MKLQPLNYKIMDTLTKAMLSCEDKTGQIANNFREMAKDLHSMKIMDMLVKELVYIDDVATLGIKQAILNRTASNVEIIEQLKSQIHDGYDKLSLQLTNEIKKF